MKIAIINGPNLNLLGLRNNKIYGSTNYDDAMNAISTSFKDISFTFFQSNCEGEIIDFMQELRLKKSVDGIVINAGAYTHYSYAIADCIEDVNIPCVEVHISNINSRETFRQKSVIAPNCIGTVSGFGLYSYNLGIMAIKNYLS